MPVIVVLDTETTGIDSTAGHTVVEVAVVPLENGVVGRGASSLVSPGRRVPPAARAVHHLGESDLRDAPKLRDAVTTVMAEMCGYTSYMEGLEVVACHNREFDQGFVGQFFPDRVRWLCTWRCALHLYPDAESHSNQALRYSVPNVEHDFRAWLEAQDPGQSLLPHRALYDAGVTAHLLREMLRNNTLEQLLELQTKPVLQRVVRFGKYRGTLWEAVPLDYCRWVLRADPPFDRDVVHTARAMLGG